MTDAERTRTGSAGDASGIARVQRPLAGVDMPVLHVEPRVPRIAPADWLVAVDGHVDVPRVVPLDELRALESVAANWDFHCVWGWSRRLCRWSGIRGATFADHAGITTDYVRVGAYGGMYASALTREEFAAGMLATHRDGEPLDPGHGGPLRFVPPPGKWQYKGVKWAACVTAIDTFVPGFWEKLTGDPHGDIPPGQEDLRHEQ